MRILSGCDNARGKEKNTLEIIANDAYYCAVKTALNASVKQPLHVFLLRKGGTLVPASVVQPWHICLLIRGGTRVVSAPKTQKVNLFTCSLYCKKHTQDVTVVGLLAFYSLPLHRITSLVGWYIRRIKCRIKSRKVNLKKYEVIFLETCQFYRNGRSNCELCHHCQCLIEKQKGIIESCHMLGCQLDIARAIFAYFFFFF